MERLLLSCLQRCVATSCQHAVPLLFDPREEDKKGKVGLHTLTNKWIRFELRAYNCSMALNSCNKWSLSQRRYISLHDTDQLSHF